MNAIGLRSQAGPPAVAGDSDIEAWARLAEIAMPVTMAWGELDVEAFNQRCRTLVERLPRATGRELPGRGPSALPGGSGPGG